MNEVILEGEGLLSFCNRDVNKRYYRLPTDQEWNEFLSELLRNLI